MKRVGALLPLAAALGCYDWTLPPGASASDAGPEAGNDVIVGEGLLAWWRFEEAEGARIGDSSGHGNDGDAFGGTSHEPGRVGTALRFNGADAFVHVADNGTLQFPQGLTVAMWMNVAAANYDQRLIGTFSTWQCKLNARHPQIDVGSAGYATLQYDLPISAWHHVAFTYDQGNARGYVDGQPAAPGDSTFTSAPNPSAPSGGLNIAASYQASTPANQRSEQPYFLSGMLDDVRIYARPLGADEIAKLAAP